MKCRAELDATKQLIIMEGKQTEAQIGQVAKQLASLEDKTEMAANSVYQQVDDLKRQVCSMEHGHDRTQQQISLLQKTEKSLQSELMKLQSRVDDIQKNSSSAQITDLVNHLITLKSEAEEAKARFEKHLQLLERRMESVEKSLQMEEIGQKLQKLQAETQRIENDVREDVKKDLEDFKQQILQEWSLFSGSTAELEPAAMATTEGDHFTPIPRSGTEVTVIRRKQPVTCVDLPESFPSSGPNASMFADDSSTPTTDEVKRASRASSGYYSVSSRPTSMARSESNVSLCTQRLSQFSLEEFEVLKEEDGDPDPKINDEVN